MSDIAGRIFPARPSLRYVVLRHEGIDDPHFDLMFETSPGSELTTWRSAKWPIDSETPLVRLKDHRRDYLEFEGALTNDRGHVQRVTSGKYRLDRPSDSVWRITIRDFVAISQLEFRHLKNDQWRAEPRRV